MRVLHYTRDFPPRVNGGLSTAVGGLVGALRDAGVDARVVSFDAWRPRHNGRATPPAPPEDGVMRLRVPAQLQFVREHVAELAPDLVHVHDARLFEVLPVRCPRVFSVHVAQGALRRLRGLDAPTLGEQAEVRALAEADAVVCPSRFTREEVGVGEVLPLGVSVPVVTRPPPDRPVVLFAGRFADVKGLTDLIDAFPRVVGAIPGALLRVAGGLPDNRGSERRWRRRLEALGDGVEMLGWLGADALARALDDAQLLVAPSWTESYGSSVVEAMARARPVVASRAGALAERLEDGVSGRLVPPRDPIALAEAIVSLLSDDAARQRMGAAARQRAEQEAWPQRVEGYTSLYRRLG
ncbi:MAG: glycosyltransferase family 4 protein [Sandaracinaceae bacterium]